MKLISMTVIAVFLFASSAQAKKSKKTSKKFTKTTKTTSKFDIRKPIKNWFKKHNDGFRIGLSSGNLSTNLRSRKTGFDTSFKDEVSTFQVQVGHERILTKSIGHSAFLIYQNGSVMDEVARNMRISGNLTYGMTKQVYTYGGLNLGKWYGSGELEANADAGFGFQAGLGLKFHKRANVELEYLTLNNEGEVNGFNSNFTAKGLMIKINTPFSFNI